MLNRKKKQREAIKRLAIGSSVAAAAGYLAGVLTAPQSGKQTRGDIKAAAENGRSEAEKDLKQLNKDLDKLIKDAKAGGDSLSKKAQKEVEELVEKARESKDKTTEILGALKAGDAQDQDLKRALKNAKLALEHLREYLKK
jgi:gas vesicle protein